ncbi:MAG: xanthine dehydrogenase family protein molybdopterin-binding subunit [Proteobacteria bacterium]|nr:xanthine dehydrogenase family protein molybdopterin-binding subunit [Pseudomonadota bacterium]
MTAAPDARSDPRAARRLEDPRLLTGAARYIDDLACPGLLHAAIVRSPHAHARIVAIDTTGARTSPGVAGAFTAADLAADALGPLPCTAQVATVDPMIVPPRFALATDRVRHVGEPVAFVVAATTAEARDAAERVAVRYDPLPAVTDAAAALAPDAPQLHDAAPGNLAYRFRKGDRAAVDAAFAAAAHSVTLDLVNPRLIVVPIEPRGAIAEADGQHLILSGAGVHGIRDALAAIFHQPPATLRVSAPEVGGGFGVKNAVYPEYVLLLWAARRLRRPIKWIADRAEDFVSTAQGRDNRTTARLALDAEGRFLALDVATIADLGAHVAGFGPGTSTNAPATAMGGPYAIPAAHMDVRGVLTNTVPIDAYRGAGKPEANYLTERLIEAAARQLGQDPFAFRRANLVATFPYRNALGTTIDSGGFIANLDAAEAAADRPGLVARKQAAAARGKLRGQGVACYLETSRGQPNEAAEIRFDPDGRIALLVGTQSTGMGHETAYAQIASARLGLPPTTFRYVQADTAQVRTGGGHGGARSMHMGGGALVCAIDALLAKARPLAARLLQANPDDLAYADGAFRTPDGRAVTLAAIAADPDRTVSLDTHAENICDVFTFPSGCHVAEVEIDPETGAVTLDRYVAVDDFGRLINPLLTVGQVQGGLAQGIGQALLERTAYDPVSGQLLSGSLMDYALPRAADLPDLCVTLTERPTAANPLGVKGSGQAGAMIAPQTVMHAVLDALAPRGVRHLDMPATAERVWRALGAGEKEGHGQRLWPSFPPA